MDYIKKHKKKVCIIAIVVLFLILVFISIHSLMPDMSKSTWGNRLDNIQNYSITDDNINKIKESLTTTGKVSNVTYRLSGRTMNFIIEVNSGVKRSDAEGLVSHITDNLTDEIKGYYDIEAYFTTSGDDTSYPFMGYKHKTGSTFSFSYAGDE